MQIEFILYVADQEKSKEFYSVLLNKTPSLHVPGMTEFELNENVKLGLMPNNGIAKIIEHNSKHPSEGTGIPRCELYLLGSEFEQLNQNAKKINAKLIDEGKNRDWGHHVIYYADPDEHIIAIAKPI